MPDSLAWLGFEPVDLLNFPGRVAAALFTRGCPLRCPYCHNPGLVGPLPGPDTPPEPGLRPRDEVLARLKQRRGFIQGVVIGGGEPLMHRDLASLASQLAALVPAIKLDTSGVYPDRLAALLEQPALVRVGLDLKTALDNYHRLGLPEGGELVARSLDRLRPWLAAKTSRHLDLRTTLAPGVTDARDLDAIDQIVAQLSAACPGQVHYSRHAYKPAVCLDPALQA